MKRKKQLLKNLKRDFATKQKEKEALQKRQENYVELQSSISGEKRKIKGLEDNLYDPKNFDALKEEMAHFKRLNEEDRAIIQDEMVPSIEKRRRRKSCCKK